MKEVRKAIYVRKKFWESSSAYENRVNILINWASKHPERELSSIGEVLILLPYFIVKR